MFNEARFREMLRPSSGNVNDYFTHICSKYADLEGSNKTCRPGKKEVEQYS